MINSCCFCSFCGMSPFGGDFYSMRKRWHSNKHYFLELFVFTGLKALKKKLLYNKSQWKKKVFKYKLTFVTIIIIIITIIAANNRLSLLVNYCVLNLCKTYFLFLAAFIFHLQGYRQRAQLTSLKKYILFLNLRLLNNNNSVRNEVSSGKRRAEFIFQIFWRGICLRKHK